jgi:hypothetical protein
VRAAKGYHPEGEAIGVGAWPTQFIPVFSPLTREAVEQAETADYEGVPFRVVGANYLAVIALERGSGQGLDAHLGIAGLPWPEKIRIAQMIRESASHLRGGRRAARSAAPVISPAARPPS